MECSDAPSYRDSAEPTAEYLALLRERWTREVEPYAFVIGARVARIAAGRASMLFAALVALARDFAPERRPVWPSHHVLLWLITPFVVAAVLGCGFFAAWLWYRVRLPAARGFAARVPQASSPRAWAAVLERGVRDVTGGVLERCGPASERWPFLGTVALVGVTLVSVGTMVPKFAKSLAEAESIAVVFALTVTLVVCLRCRRPWREVVAFEDAMVEGKMTADALAEHHRDAVFAVAWRTFTVCVVALLLVLPFVLLFEVGDSMDCIEHGPGACDAVFF